MVTARCMLEEVCGVGGKLRCGLSLDSLFELSGRALDHSSLRADVGPVTSVGVRDDSERGTCGGGGDKLRVLEQAFERRVSRGERA
jgi:hypothetical protein